MTSAARFSDVKLPTWIARDLPLDRGDKFRVGVAQACHADAGQQVDVPLAVHVDQHRSLAVVDAQLAEERDALGARREELGLGIEQGDGPGAGARGGVGGVVGRRRGSASAVGCCVTLRILKRESGTDGTRRRPRYDGGFRAEGRETRPVVEIDQHRLIARRQGDIAAKNVESQLLRRCES